MLALARVAGAVGASPTAGTGVLGRAAAPLALGAGTVLDVLGAAPGAFAVRGRAAPLAALRAARFALRRTAPCAALTAARVVLGGTASLPLGATRAALLRAASAAPSVIGRGAAPGALLLPPETAFSFRGSAPSGTLFPGRRAIGPAPSAVAAGAARRALGPATAAIGIPSSFGTHVVLDCLSRPVGLTIPWWNGGTVPLGDR